jgi:hypothetical protein
MWLAFSLPGHYLRYSNCKIAIRCQTEYWWFVNYRWLMLCYIFSYFKYWPLLWSIAQSSWLQIQRSWFDYRRYQIFWEVVGLERGPLSPVSTTEELLGRKSRSCGLESKEYGRREQPRWLRGILYPQKLALASPTSGSRSVGIVRSRTQTTEFF